MKRLLISACLLLPPLLTHAAPATPAEVTLSGTGTAKPLGVEPVGGRFQSLLPERAKAGEKGETKFSTTSRMQEKSTLAIFASESPYMHDEKPLARVEISGLHPGEQKDRIRVRLTVRSPYKLTVEAWDAPSGLPLGVRQLTSSEVRQARYAPASAKPAPIASSDSRQPAPIASIDRNKPAPIASRDTRSGLAQAIGVRAAGGLIQPLLPAGTPEKTTKSYYLRPRFPDQTTADISLFTGDGPYIENNKLWERYLISGLPTGANRRIKLDFTVGSDGQLLPPKATEITSKQELHIQKFSVSAAQRLEEAARSEQAPAVRHIPPTPTGGG